MCCTEECAAHAVLSSMHVNIQEQPWTADYPGVCMQ